jgi:DNA/RNA-binding domain of Phe-tRNA-synthetase-like protein
MRVTIAPPLDSIVRLGVLGLDDLHITERDEPLDEPLAHAADALRTGADLEPHLAATRSMYRRLGIDPTKTRPSSEALLRRLKKGDPFPRINTLVDICNWCAAEFQLPYGLYDRDRIVGDVQLRAGAAGEEYAGIRKDVVHLEGRPTLVDDSGPFGNPTSDSSRTMVTPATTRALLVVFAPRGMSRDNIDRILDATAERALRYAHGAEVFRDVLSAA